MLETSALMVSESVLLCAASACQCGRSVGARASARAASNIEHDPEIMFLRKTDTTYKNEHYVFGLFTHICLENKSINNIIICA